MKNIFKVLSLSALGFASLPTFAEEVSVLVLYTEAAEAIAAGGSIDDRIQTYIDASNDSYEASNIDIQLTLAASRRINGVDDSRDAEGNQNYDTDTALRDLTNARGNFTGVPQLRDTFGADFVVLLRDISDTGGLGWVVNSNRNDLAYNVVRIQNSLYTFAHEIGHNMGLAHSRPQVADGGVAGIEPHAAGHGLDRDTPDENGFVTIMAYRSAFNNAPKLDIFSNPDTNCDSGTSVTPCGIEETDTVNGADAASVLNERREVYSGYRLSPLVGSVTFADANLSGCVAPSNNVLIPNMTNLECANQNIESLDGVENLTALTYVNFQNNNLFSLSPLFDLPNLQSAVVSGNDRAICSHLNRLEDALGSSNVTRSSECFPLAAVLVSVTSVVL